AARRRRRGWRPPPTGCWSCGSPWAGCSATGGSAPPGARWSGGGAPPGRGGGRGRGRRAPPVCAVFEGWDASGKGGAIRRLVNPMDPRHVRVATFAAPTYDEKRHHFLWRFWSSLPRGGGMAVLDRSWYGRVLVER